MKTALTTLTVALLGLAAAHANADAYAASIQGCEKAIADRLGTSVGQTDYSIRKIQSSAHYRDVTFSVSAADAATPIQQLKVSCRAQENGQVLAVQFDEAALIPAVATH